MNILMSRSVFFILSALLLLPISTAMAHTGMAAPSGVLLGLSHPFSGMDHMLAMLAVGLWAGNLGGRALWIVPGTFVMVMVIGGALGMSGLAAPFIEAGILSSIVVLGILIASTVRLPVIFSALIVGFFAFFHGHAHGTELLATSAGAPWYIFGFTLATIFLHGLGMVLSINLQRLEYAANIIRLLGSAIALGGLYLAA